MFRSARRAWPGATLVALSSALPARGSEIVRPEIVATYPHDPAAFTQGLLLHDGKLYESTGLFGRSSLRRVTLATGAVEKSVALPSDLFGEGLALVADRLFQLTWQNGRALVYDLDFNQVAGFDYPGEGWGLCYDGSRLVMSDGSSRLRFRDPESFAVIGEVEVRDEGRAVPRLNELECVGSIVYANVWQTNAIVSIDAATGRVLQTVDASGLLSPAEAASVDVLNGIAHDPARGHFFVTGKLWPKLFELRLPAAPGDAGTPGAGSPDASEPAPSDPPPESEPRTKSACGCALPGLPDAGDGPWAVAVLVVAAALRRRAAR